MKRKKRNKVEVPAGNALVLAEEWFGQSIPEDLIVRFNRKEIVHAHSYGGLSRFFRGLVKGILYGTACPVCGSGGNAIWLPPRAHCPDCWKEMKWMAVDTGKAKVYSHSTTNLPGAGFMGSVPCPLISIDIPGVCTKFMSYMSEFAEDEPYIGMRVRPVFRTKDPTYTILDISWVPRNEN